MILREKEVEKGTEGEVGVVQWTESGMSLITYVNLGTLVHTWATNEEV